jgi:hypothetical protein
MVTGSPPIEFYLTSICLPLTGSIFSEKEKPSLVWSLLRGLLWSAHLDQYSVLIGIQGTKTNLGLVIPKKEWANNTL